MRVAHAETQTLQERAIAIAESENFDPEIVINNINTETGGTWDCTHVGTSGELGCLQIIPELHPGVDPLNFEESVRYFIHEYKAGRGWQWTGCSCVQSAKLTVKLPPGDAKDFKPNTDMEHGKIAILRYNKEYHLVAYKIAPEGLYALREGNFKPCLIQDRLIQWKEVNTHIVGFWKPGTSP